jgi:ABC-type transport system substrate-binding protein
MGADPELTLTFAADRSPPAGRNINYFQNAELTKVLYASDLTVDQARRRDLLREAQRRIAELAVEIPIYNTSKIDAVPVAMRNFKGNPAGGLKSVPCHSCSAGSRRPYRCCWSSRCSFSR